MARWKVYTGLSMAAALLTWLGVKKYAELSAIKLLEIIPAKPAFQFIRVKEGLIDGLIHISVKNPTQYNYRVKDLKAAMYLPDVNGQPGAYLASVNSFSYQLGISSVTMLSVPVQLVFSQLLTLAKNIFLDRTATIFLTGSVTYVTSGVSVPVPFQFSVDVKEQLNLFFQQNKLPVTL